MDNDFIEEALVQAEINPGSGEVYALLAIVVELRRIRKELEMKRRESWVRKILGAFWTK